MIRPARPRALFPEQEAEGRQTEARLASCGKPQLTSHEDAQKANMEALGFAATLTCEEVNAMVPFFRSRSPHHGQSVNRDPCTRRCLEKRNPRRVGAACGAPSCRGLLLPGLFQALVVEIVEVRLDIIRVGIDVGEEQLGDAGVAVAQFLGQAKDQRRAVSSNQARGCRVKREVGCAIRGMSRGRILWRGRSARRRGW